MTEEQRQNVRTQILKDLGDLIPDSYDDEDEPDYGHRTEWFEPEPEIIDRKISGTAYLPYTGFCFNELIGPDERLVRNSLKVTLWGEDESGTKVVNPSFTVDYEFGLIIFPETYREKNYLIEGKIIKEEL